MRILGLLLVATLLAGCTNEGTVSSTPRGKRGTADASTDAVPPERREEYRQALDKANRETGKISTMNAVVGASVEDARHPGVFYCAKCGSMLGPNGACPICNPQGMPGFGLQSTPHTNPLQGSTSPR